MIKKVYQHVVKVLHMGQSGIYISPLGLFLVFLLASFCGMTCKNAKLNGSKLNREV